LLNGTRVLKFGDERLHPYQDVGETVESGLLIRIVLNDALETALDEELYSAEKDLEAKFNLVLVDTSTREIERIQPALEAHEL
jgi:hypothetical protein